LLLDTDCSGFDEARGQDKTAPNSGRITRPVALELLEA